MKISTKSRYGTRLMLNLALHLRKGQVLLKDVAKEEEISEKYLSQIIIPLKAAGLVKSFRGAHGGYILAKPPKDITIKLIIEAVEGDLALVDCVKDATSCSRAPMCITRELWSELGEKISNTLEAITLADLVKRCWEKEETHLMYNI